MSLAGVLGVGELLINIAHSGENRPRDLRQQSSAQHAIKVIKDNAGDAQVVDLT